ncbi:hypothetical protein [Sphingobium sp.]|uniref:hypothetical protein n=1 Tax=Sphingobium sp. TaxID=1912891 RepID=UPI003B3B32C7
MGETYAAMPGLAVEGDAGFIKIRLLNAQAIGAVADAIGLPSPPPLRESRNGPVALATIGPAEWLLSCPLLALPDMIATIGRALEGEVALVLDVSPGRVACLMQGDAAERLCALSPVDLSDRAFPVAAVARTIVEDISTMIVRLENGFRAVVDQSRAARFLAVVTRGS